MKITHNKSARMFVTKSFTVAHEVEAIVIVSQSASQTKITQKRMASRLSPRTTVRLVCVLLRRTQQKFFTSHFRFCARVLKVINNKQ